MDSCPLESVRSHQAIKCLPKRNVSQLHSCKLAGRHSVPHYAHPELFFSLVLVCSPPVAGHWQWKKHEEYGLCVEKAHGSRGLFHCASSFLSSLSDMVCFDRAAT